MKTYVNLFLEALDEYDKSERQREQDVQVLYKEIYNLE